MNENLFATFTTPSIMGITTLPIIMFLPCLILTSPKRWLPNRIQTLQTWLIRSITKQMMTMHNKQGRTWTLMLMSLILFIASTNLLGLLPYSFTPTTQLSMNIGMAIPLWLGTVLMGFRNKPKTSLAHFLPQGTPTPLIPMLIIIETISLFIQPLALAVRLTANITAGHLLIHLIGSATLALSSINMMVSSITFIILFLLTILELAVAMIQAYVFTLLVSLYLHDNS
uniref:ATP synthase subunit a n=1 Tax=Phalanger orientalis TaxID=42473 RepID=A0A7T1NM48_PHAOR|nr:ATP synthase F0 subunit 6 [Phalanger orientalis]QPO06087.1 ATP synthase F0 subunit 6 [Phalanger orientalis]QPO06100.1 ATP synthase F0 subunit 6 [Phalanger orientalis]QPO06113.1 ATP synthase F0 subunit 6 [Phalanger orientalis]QPO06126.1 ATP synthase F0 subunit 6 [Phalanger orientalis]QPO06139.1 ATP synthase F0 subunit 6 [Phalanger orientalis]